MENRGQAEVTGAGGLEQFNVLGVAAAGSGMAQRSTMRDALITLALIGQWYYSNFQFGFGLKHESGRFQDLELCLFLLWTLFAVGWAAAWVARFVYSQLPFEGGDAASHVGHLRDEEAASCKPHAAGEAAHEAERRPPQLLVVVAHTLGMSFTCLAFIAGSVPVVQVLKSLAPIFTTVLSMCYLNAVFPYSAVAAVSLLVLGASMSTWKTPGLNATAVLMCMVTNLSLPLRNVMVKRRTLARPAAAGPVGGGRARPSSARLALDTAVELNFGGMVILTPLCLVFMSSFAVPAADARVALRLGLHRIAYEIASLLVLTRIDAVMHGSLDVLKRAAMTLIALATFESVRALNLAGSLLAFGTLLWYKLSLSRQAAAGSPAGHAFYLPDAWKGTVVAAFKAGLCVFTTFGLRLFILARVSEQ